MMIYKNCCKFFPLKRCLVVSFLFLLYNPTPKSKIYTVISMVYLRIKRTNYSLLFMLLVKHDSNCCDVCDGKSSMERWKVTFFDTQQMFQFFAASIRISFRPNTTFLLSFIPKMNFSFMFRPNATFFLCVFFECLKEKITSKLHFLIIIGKKYLHLKPFEFSILYIVSSGKRVFLKGIYKIYIRCLFLSKF